MVKVTIVFQERARKIGARSRHYLALSPAN